MALPRFLACFIFALLLFCIASEGTDEKTTEAVVKAVVQAESKPKATPRNSQEAEEAKNKEEARAAAKATLEVLDSETSTGADVSKAVIDSATKNAEKTFVDLVDDGVSTKAAADAAARVAVASVDGASNLAVPHGAKYYLAVPHGAKVNAEKAAIAAAQGVADHPNSQGEALMDAVSTVKKEEKASGKALQKEKSKGIMAEAKDAVKDLPKMAKEGADSVAQKAANLSGVSLFLMIAVVAGLFIGVKNFDAVRENTPYLKRLKAIREEFHGDGTPADYERGFIQTEYKDYNEMEMR